MRFCMSSVSSPAWAMPVTSPLTSAMNTGTPAWEKPSAMTLRVTVLPVPEAPAMRPWRFAWLRSSLQGLSPWAIQIAPSWSMCGCLSRSRRRTRRSGFRITPQCTVPPSVPGRTPKPRAPVQPEVDGRASAPARGVALPPRRRAHTKARIRKCPGPAPRWRRVRGGSCGFARCGEAFRRMGGRPRWRSSGASAAPPRPPT